jgi:hypothetical protein
VGFEVITAVSTKMGVFWDVTPCSLVEVYQRFRGPCCLHHEDALMMEAGWTSETLVNFYQTTRRNNPEDSHLPIYNLFYDPLLGRIIRKHASVSMYGAKSELTVAHFVTESMNIYNHTRFCIW